MTSASVRLRSARSSDAEAISELLALSAAAEIVLPRSPDEVRAYIDNFIVATDTGATVGAVALRDFGNGLEEIRSLVIAPGYQGRGWGSQLVQAAIDLAVKRSTRRVFALTLRPGLFERLGFAQVDKSTFPQKVWSDCAICTKRDRCDEVAVLLELGAGA